MPTPQFFPYKLRVQFTAQQERGLKAAATRDHRSINAIIRRYVDDGLKRDGLADLPDAPLPGQTTIEGDE